MYSVFVPAKKDSEMPDLSIRVEASNWLVALRESLRQVGEQGSTLSNIVCETAPDGSLRVADPGSRRVFVIKQVTDAGQDQLAKEADERAAESRRLAEAAAKAKEETETRLKEVQTQMAAPTVPEVKTVEQDDMVKKLAEERAKLEAQLAEARAKLEAAAHKAAEEATGVVKNLEIQKVEKKPPKEEPKPKGKEKGKEKEKAKAAPAKKEEWGDLDDWYDNVDVAEQTIDNVVSDLFLATENLHEKEEVEAAGFVLELANRYCDAEAASVFYTDFKSALKDLAIVAASGPIGQKITGLRVPLGRGIVGFSVVNKVKLIVNQVDKNPNFYGRLDQEFGFKTKSILCVPITHEEMIYGALELVNKKGADPWNTFDSNVMESLAKLLGKAIQMRVALAKD
jgi:chemotaxis protein histidine kinase CheA